MINRSSYGILDLAGYNIGESSIALSLRKLSSIYTGAAIRVRRSLDNIQQDIGFVSNTLDTAAATTFASGSNLFITKFYNQVFLGNDFVQTTAANQPKLVFNKIGGTKPSIEWDGVNDYLVSTWNAQIFAKNKPRLTAFFVNISNANNAGTNSSATLLGVGSVAASDFFIPFRKNSTSQAINTRHADGTNSVNFGWSGTGSAFTTAINVHSYIDNGSSCALRTKGLAVGSGVPTNLTAISDITIELRLGHVAGSSGSFWFGDIPEVIILPNEINTTTSLLIESNQISYYGIV